MVVVDQSPLIVSTLGIALATSCLSTGLIHYCISPYVTDIEIMEESLQIGTLSLFGNRIVTKFDPTYLQTIHNKPFTNWLVKGDSKTFHPWNIPVRERKKFYVHTNLEDLKPDMKMLIEKVSLSDRGIHIKDMPSEDWDAKVNELKKEL
jgi:hypothetical protein